MLKDKLNAVIEIAAETDPDAWSQCYPRQIVPPSNYQNPRIYSANLWAHTRYWHDTRLSASPHVTENLVVQHLIQEKVPTYFVSEDLAVAVNKTRLPDEFTLTSIQWPREALLFVLPTEFVLKTFKANTPFVSVVRVKAGSYPKTRFSGMRQPYALDNLVDRMCVHYPLYYDNEMPADFTGNMPTTLTQAQFSDMPYVDVVPYESSLTGVSVGNTATMQGVAATEETEKALGKAIDLFVVKLMFVLTACPHLVREPSLHRPQKTKRGKVVQRELWNANVIGLEFKLSNESSNGHASPRTHIRWGHLRNQPYGPGNSLCKTIWIAPVLVNPPTL